MEETINLEKIYRKLEKLELFMKKFEQLAEDLEFARRTEEAHERIEAGEYISVDSENLSNEMMKW